MADWARPGCSLRDYFQLPVPEVPLVQTWPVQTVMIGCWAQFGIVLAILARFTAGAGRHRTETAQAAAAATAEHLVVGPVEFEVSWLVPSTLR